MCNTSPGPARRTVLDLYGPHLSVGMCWVCLGKLKPCFLRLSCARAGQGSIEHFVTGPRPDMLFAGRPDSSNHVHAPDGLFMMILMHVVLCPSKCNRLAYQEAHVDFASPMSASNARALSFDRECVANKHDYYVPLKWAWQTITRINCQDFASPWQAHEPRVAFFDNAPKRANLQAQKVLERASRSVWLSIVEVGSCFT